MSNTKFSENFVSGEVKYVRKSDKKIRQMAVEYFGGNLFGSWAFDEADYKSMMPMVFMPLSLMSEVQIKTLVRDEVDHVYGYMKDSAPRSINGYPIFYAMHMINREDFNRFTTACALLQEFMGEDENGN